jgi:hypothetical protein
VYGQTGTISMTVMRAMLRPLTTAELRVREIRHAGSTRTIRAAFARPASTQDWGFQRRVSRQAGSRIASQLLRTRCHLVKRKASIISQGHGEDEDADAKADQKAMLSSSSPHPSPCQVLRSNRELSVKSSEKAWARTFCVCFPCHVGQTQFSLKHA